MHKRWFAAALILAMLAGAACSAAAPDVAGQCRFWVSEGSARAITDNDMNSAWSPRGSEPELRIQLPDGGAAWIQIDWALPPESYTLTEYDAERNAIVTRTQADDEFAPISQLLPLRPEARYVSIAFSQKKQGIHRVRVFPEGELPATVVAWEPPHEKCDLMVISTHEDDEWLWFGAIIPYYDLVQDKDVQVVYMADCGRLRYGEALNSLAVSGVRTYPLFVGLTDKRDSSLNAAIQTWHGRDAILEVLVSVIRRFQPEVILTHDWNGEYGHPQHILTSRAMEYAIEAAADPAQYPESAEQYGAWQVKKLYRHLETKGRIAFDWHVAYPEFGGRTGIQVATDSMNEHASQLKWFQVEDHGEYDNSLFGLSYSTVGDDVRHDDLFENIPTATPAPTPTPEPTDTPAPTAEPTAGPTAAPTEAPVRETAAPRLTPEPAPAREGGDSTLGILVGAAALAVAGIVGAAVYIGTARRRMRHKKRRR